MRLIDRTGEVNFNNYGSRMVIVEYKNAHEVLVEFEQGNITHTEYRHFKNGNVKNPYDITLCGVGFLGDGIYKSKENGKWTEKYITWRNMIARCYSERRQEDNPTYVNCTVAEEWHNFQSFAKWYDENYYKIDGQNMQLDKDITIKGNKVYSPNTCVFVPQSINLLFTRNNTTEELIREVAEEYKNKIPNKLYNAMISYKI